MRKTILIFGSISVAVILLFQLSKLSLMSNQGINDLLLILSGILFIAIGYYITRLFYRKQNEDVIKQIDQDRIKQLKISKQEHRVLGLMSEGLSNIEIAEHLFISENTVKTHVSRILSKLNARRRTEAIKIGRDLNII